MQNIDIEQFKKFLITSKINGYASSGEGGENILIDGSKELKYQNGNYKYRDRYFGSKYFIGEEIVWRDDEYFWGMNFYGGVFLNIVSTKDVYQFLQKALKKININNPLRGPDNFIDGDFKYVNKTDGSIGNFKGEEFIFYKKQKIYKLDYHGGFIYKNVYTPSLF